MIRGVAPLNAMGLLILGGASIALLELMAQEIQQEEVIPTVKVEWAPKLSTSAEPSGTTAPLSSYRQTTARPVFFKTRQPFAPPPPSPPPKPPPAAKPAPAPPPADPGLSAGGVIITNRTKKAYLFSKTDRNGSWLGEGEEIMGWRVQSIDRKGARLTKDGREIELPLYAQP